MQWLDDDPAAAAARAEWTAHGGGAPDLEIADARPPEFSDESLALRFSERHADDARHVAAWGRWLLWDGSRWAFDETLKTFDLARTICRIASAEITEPKQIKLASAVASARTVAAVANLARADRRHAAAIEQWDSDSWTFFCETSAPDDSD